MSKNPSPRNLSDAAKERKMAYDREYASKNVTRKSIYFSRLDPDDMKMVGWLDSKGNRNISGYVKGLIRDDMNKNGE